MCCILSYILQYQQPVEAQVVIAMGVDALIKLFGPCGKNQEKRETSPGIWTCQQCFYGMHNPDGKGCVFCPQDTLVTAGRHYESIIDWCEADCYRSYKQMMEMDHYTRSWYISSFANVPCIRYMYPFAQVQTATGDVESIVPHDTISMAKTPVPI
jgi:hypothetical protein